MRPPPIMIFHIRVEARERTVAWPARRPIGWKLNSPLEFFNCLSALDPGMRIGEASEVLGGAAAVAGEPARSRRKQRKIDRQVLHGLEREWRSVVSGSDQQRELGRRIGRERHRLRVEAKQAKGN